MCWWNDFSSFVPSFGPNASVSDETGARWQVAAVRNERQDLRSLDVARRLVGLRPEQAEQELSDHLDLAGAPQITLQPAWWPWMPFLADRIEVMSP